MHLLMVSEYFPPVSHGGGETSAFALAKALAKNGTIVSVLTSAAPNLSAFEVMNDVNVYRRLSTGATSNSVLGNLDRVRLTGSIKRELPQLIAELKPDVVHALNITSMPGVAASTTLPAIAHINSPLAFDPKGTLLDEGKEREGPYTFWSFVRSFVGSDMVGRLANKWYLRYNPVAWLFFYCRWTRIRDSFPKFAHFFPISATMQRWLVTYGVPKEKTTVLPNIVPIAAKSQIKSHKVPWLFFDGGYAPIKGLPTLLDALKNVTLPYELHVVGTGDSRAMMEAHALHNKIKVVFHGFVPESEHLALMAQSDIIVFPSLVPEGLGRLVLLGMAAGKPVLASRIGGMTETVLDGKTGLLLTPGAVDEWKTSIEQLLSSATIRARMGKAGKARFAKEYSADSIVTKAIATYKQVLR